MALQHSRCGACKPNTRDVDSSSLSTPLFPAIVTRTMRLFPRKRRWRVLLALVAVLAAAWFVVPALLVPTIQRKLQAMMATQFKADVRIGSLRYSPPYGVRARDLSLIADDPKHGQVEVLNVGLLDLK